MINIAGTLAQIKAGALNCATPIYYNPPPPQKKPGSLKNVIDKT